MPQECDGCQVDPGIDRIQSGKPQSEWRCFFEGDRQVIKRSVADEDKGDGVSQVPHDLGEVRHFWCGATTPDNRGHPDGAAGKYSPSRIGRGIRRRHDSGPEVVVRDDVTVRRTVKVGVSLASGLALALGLYLACAAYLLRFGLDSLLFPHVSELAESGAPAAVRIADASGNALLLRRYGQALIGCAIFFPGQHGELSGYPETLFRKLSHAGVAIFAVSYPDQDGASGSATTENIILFSYYRQHGLS